MPVTTAELLKGKPEPVSVRLLQPASEALELMLTHDYDQLPVVDDANQPIWIVTALTILQAADNMQEHPKNFLVRDAKAKVEVRSHDIEIPDLARLLLQQTSCVLIVNGLKELVGIVTLHDALDYYRKRAEDLMYVEEVEFTLRDLMRRTFPDPIELEARLNPSVDGPSRNDFILARNLLRHLSETGILEKGISEEVLRAAVKAVVKPVERPHKKAEDMSFYDTQQLLLGHGWERIAPMFSVPRDAVDNRLTLVRQARNQIAHFRGELTPKQSKDVRHAALWLNGLDLPLSLPEIHGESNVVLEDVTIGVVGIPTQEAVGSVTVTALDDMRPDLEDMGTEAPSAEDGRYAALANHLSSLPAAQGSVRLSFLEIKAIIGGELPESATSYRAWWANDDSHVQARYWLQAGWRSGSINLAEGKVTFHRIAGQQPAFIAFYTQVVARLRASAPAFPYREYKIIGDNWHTVAVIPPTGGQMLFFNYAFGWRGRFRVELYIATGDRDRNKRIFDNIERHAGKLAEHLPGEWSWQRLDHRDASRISISTKGSAIDEKQKVADLVEWAALTMAAFYEAIATRAIEALEASAASAA